VAASLIAPESLDFVYIDASHDYESVKQDLACWWPKVKFGGMFAGHDYFEHYEYVKFGIIEAVDEFAAKNSLTVGVTGEEEGREHRAKDVPLENFSPSWYISKTKAVFI
jgi:hypothetical protein